jgi:hypothetical protein
MESNLQKQRLGKARKFIIRHRRKSEDWWRQSFGLSQEDLDILKQEIKILVKDLP